MSSTDRIFGETELERKVRQRRKELWEREFGPESEAMKKWEDSIWGKQEMDATLTLDDVIASGDKIRRQALESGTQYISVEVTDDHRQMERHPCPVCGQKDMVLPKMSWRLCLSRGWAYHANDVQFPPPIELH